MITAKSTRVTNVQVPGAEPAPAPAAAPAPATSGSAPANEAPAPTLAPPATAAPAVNIEALRAQIREEERDNARRELGAQIQAAASVVRDPAAGNSAPQRSKADYRNMRATDIDPATLTAPVMTLDGYLCPPAPEKK